MNMTGMYLNMDTWSPSKHEELRDIARGDPSLAFIAVTEVNRPTNEMVFQELSIDGFTHTLHPRIGDSDHGGMLIWIKERINVSLEFWKSVEGCMEGRADSERYWLLITSETCKLAICSAYMRVNRRYGKWY